MGGELDGAKLAADRSSLNSSDQGTQRRHRSLYGFRAAHFPWDLVAAFSCRPLPITAPFLILNDAAPCELMSLTCASSPDARQTVTWW